MAEKEPITKAPEVVSTEVAAEASKAQKYDVLRTFSLQEAPIGGKEQKEAHRAADELAKKAGGEFKAPEKQALPEGDVKTWSKGDVFESDNQKRIAYLQKEGKISKKAKE